MLYVISFRDLKDVNKDGIVINTTSRSTNWTKGLSPFVLEGGYLYDKYYAINIENAWQYSKVYKEYVDSNKNPTDEYFKWAKKGWASSYAHRYPMGKGVIPLYSYWNGEKLTYVEARKKIYIPLYIRGALKSEAFQKLKNLYLTTDKDIYLLDFDGYNHVKEGISDKDVVNDPDRKMGHAFVLYFMLTQYKENI